MYMLEQSKAFIGRGNAKQISATVLGFDLSSRLSAMFVPNGLREVSSELLGTCLLSTGPMNAAYAAEDRSATKFFLVREPFRDLWNGTYALHQRCAPNGHGATST